MNLRPGRLLGGGVNTIAHALAVSDFIAPLSRSTVLTKGTGAPSFTRATTATVADNEGVLRTALAGESRFTGARRVRNLIPTTSENFDNAAWTKNAGGAGSAPVVTADQDANPIPGVAFADKVVFTAPGAGDISMLSSPAATTIVNNVIRGTFYVKAFAVGDVGKVLLTRHAGASSFTAVTLTASYQRLGSLETAGVTSTTLDIGLRPTFGGSSGTVSVLLAASMLEDVTGQSVQTAGEYVSVGVLSAPYHGANVDGVKDFNTTLAGAAIPTATLKGELVESARTNLCTKSKQFDAWTTATGGGGSLPVVTANQVAAPDGALTADKVVFNAPASGDISMLSSPTCTTVISTVYTGSLYVKAFAAGDVGKVLLTRNVAAGSFGTVTLTADWQQIERAETAAATSTTIDIGLRPQFGGSTGTVSCYLSDGQLEAGAYKTSVIPTTTVAATRNADVLSYVASGNILAAAGTLYLEFTPQHSPSGTIALFGTYVDASNYTAILHDATNLIFRKRIAGTNYDATIANAFVSGTTYKVAASWGASGVQIALTGSLGTPNSNTTAAQIGTTIQIGADGNSLQQPNASICNVRIWLRQVPNAILARITR